MIVLFFKSYAHTNYTKQFVCFFFVLKQTFLKFRFSEKKIMTNENGLLQLLLTWKQSALTKLTTMNTNIPEKKTK